MVDGQVKRTCDHGGHAVIAERSSVLYGTGGATDLTLYERALSAIQKIAKVLRVT